MSGFFNKYPYTDFHELNLDWVIERVKKLTEDWLATQEEWNNTQEQWQQLHDYVMDYFANLDVQDEINNKINQMILDGTFLSIVAPTINQTVVDTTTSWLAAHITQPTTPAIDNTLTIAGAAADAKAAGDAINNLASTAFTPRHKGPGVTALADMREAGVYGIDSAEMPGFTDIPSDADQNVTSTLVNIVNAYSNGNFTLQYFIQLDDKVWQRLLISASGAVYVAWHRISDDNMVANLNSLIDYAFTPRHKGPGVTALADMREAGVYGITSAEMAGFTDIPSDAAQNVTSTLVNIVNAYDNGNFTLQYFIQLDDRIWQRLLISADGTVYVGWHLVSPAEYATRDMLYGKKIVTAGDSYTKATYTGAYASYNGKNFGYYIAQRNNMTLVNSGIDGSTMALPNDADPDRNPFSDTRYTAIPADTDYLILWFGINDAAHCDLGTIDDMTNTTFYGAWNVVLNYYLTNMPFMKVLLVVTTGSTVAFRQAVRDVAQKWGYPYLDWVDDKQIPAFFEREDMSAAATNLRKSAFGWNDFNGHPSPQWHEYASTIIESKLRSI